MRITTIGLAVAAALAGAAPAFAQIERLPETSRSESQANSINRSLDRQGQSRLQSQQNQFEVNSLRNENSVRSSAPIVVAPPIAPIR